ncbi:hypothetical protein C2E23DRAFT_726872 [Lenzites betulinus]|nr:hypothetical protein C2E23DRAFT_726872 [Lenzites betulinus]
MAVNITVDGVTITFVDSTETSLIAYDDTWHEIPASNLSGGADGGPSYGGQVGSSLSFNFTGYAMFAAATFPSVLPPNANQTLPNVTVSLDGSTPTRVSIANQDGEPFFKSGPISPITHTFSVTVDEATDEFPFILDGFGYVPIQDLEQAYSPQASQTPVTGLDNALDANQTQIEIQNLLQKLVEAQRKSNGPPVAAIVGGTIGGVILILGIASAVWYFVIRPRRNGGRAFFYAPAKASDMLQDEFDLDPEPYPLLASTRSASPPLSIHHTEPISRTVTHDSGYS